VFAEVIDAEAVIAHLLRPQLVAAAEASISADADEPNALSQAEREKRAAVISQDLLICERDEAALTWQAQSQNLPVEFRSDISPLAILQVRLVTTPRADALLETTLTHGRCGDDTDRAAGGLAACFLTGMHGRGTWATVSRATTIKIALPLHVSAMRRGAAGPIPATVSAVASGPRWDAGARHLGLPHNGSERMDQTGLNRLRAQDRDELSTLLSVPAWRNERASSPACPLFANGGNREPDGQLACSSRVSISS
jgi:hypothetical protein